MWLSQQQKRVIEGELNEPYHNRSNRIQHTRNQQSLLSVKEGYAVGECDGQIVLAEITQRTDGNYDEGTIWYIGRNVPYADLETLAEVVTHL
ncbi:hypothetical protein NF868_12995 [Bacillus zhangzhouensis]|nr:hypothetical protein NF868_12995 [Bacillus zhangzhouensis]